MPSKQEYDRRYEAGLCVECGKNKRVEHKTACQSCLAKNRDKARKKRAERIKNGLCPRCGKVADNGRYKSCKSCCEKQYERTKRNREYCKSILVCGRCQRNSIVRVGTICAECKEKAKKYKLTDEQKKVKYQKQKDRIELRKEQGICIDCGRRKAEKGKIRCIYCLQRNLKSQKRYQESKFGTQIARSERVSYGLCYFCGDKLDNNTKVCSKCKERCNYALSKIDRIKSKNKNWMQDNNLIFQRKVTKDESNKRI